MKKLFLILCIIISYFNASAETGFIGATYYSYSNIANDYKFYLHTYFNIGAGGTCPWVYGWNAQKSNDTIYIFAYYNISGGWPAMGCGRIDTIEYENKFSGINYFCLKASEFYGIDPGDTLFNVNDTTFDLSATSIRNLASMQGIFLAFPNPATNVLQIEGQNKWREAEVYNLYGQLQLKQSNRLPIDIGTLSSGMYYVVLKDEYENNIGTVKFIKQ